MIALTRGSAAALIVLGTIQMIGDVLGVAWLRGLGLATSASPAPKVFTAQQGFETYANRFFVEWSDARGTRHGIEITPAVYGAVDGPYNRRNAYGAAFSYGPVLAENPATAGMFRSVLTFAFCGKTAVAGALGIDVGAAVGPIRVRLEPRNPAAKSGDRQLSFESSCHAK